MTRQKSNIAQMILALCAVITLFIVILNQYKTNKPLVEEVVEEIVVQDPPAEIERIQERMTEDIRQYLVGSFTLNQLENKYNISRNTNLQSTINMNLVQEGKFIDYLLNIKDNLIPNKNFAVLEIDSMKTGEIVNIIIVNR